MIYQPRSIQPIHKSIDGTISNNISMVMNTTNYVESYKLTIYNMDNTIFSQGTKTSFTNNLYNGDTGYINLPTSLNLVNGTDYKWVCRLYQPNADMLITYGNVVSPTTYVYTASSSLTAGNYYFKIGNQCYVFTSPKALSSGDKFSYDSSSNVVSGIISSSDYYLTTTEVEDGNFQTLTMTASGSIYTYTVGSSGLLAGEYCFTIGTTKYWFSTISDLVSGDTVFYDTSTQLLKQNHIQSGNNITLTLSYVYGIQLTPTQSVNTSTNIYLNKNINIKDGMLLSINNVSKTISSYDVQSGLAIVSSAFPSVPTSNDTYYIYSDFIETTPENMLYVRSTPTVSISGVSGTLTSKTASLTGTYSQSEDVPLVYYLWNLYSVDELGSTLVKTSDKIYSAKIEFEYDGFKNNETYIISLVCENEFGITADASVTFDVSYTEIVYDEQPTATQTNEQGIRVSWSTTIQTEPYSVYTKNAEGYVQSSNNTTTSIWLEAGQTIYPDTTIKVGLSEATGVIATYDTNTGLATLREPLSYVPASGDYYYIYSAPDYNLTGINILTDTPYLGANSAVIGDNHLIYHKDTGLSLWPSTYQLTMQFMLDDDFFYGDNNIYKDIALIARYQGDASNGSEDLIVFAKGYNFYAITPAVSSGSLIGGTISSVEADGSAVYLNAGATVDLTKQRFIYFVEKEYLAYIDTYDSSTQKVTFDSNLPSASIPSIGDSFYLYNTVSAAYYSTPNNIFCLQNSNFVSPYADYIWTDSGSWDDTYYWVEGGTPIGRAANTWWKIQILPNSMVVTKGGV